MSPSAGQQVEIAELIVRAKAGEERAFATLYDLFGAHVYRYALVRLREPADAEDLMQRVFVKVIEALPHYEERGLPFAAWVFRIARHAVIDFERSRGRVTTLEADRGRPDPAPGPAQLAELSAERETVRQALEVLTPEQREVVIYRFFAGLSPSEIGLLMGKREGTVRAMQFRALAALRRHLGDPSLAIDETGPARA